MDLWKSRLDVYIILKILTKLLINNISQIYCHKMDRLKWIKLSISSWIICIWFSLHAQNLYKFSGNVVGNYEELLRNDVIMILFKPF